MLAEPLQLLLVLCAVLAASATDPTEHTKAGGPCAALAELEADYIIRAEEQVFNIVDPSTSIQ